MLSATEQQYPDCPKAIETGLDFIAGALHRNGFITTFIRLDGSLRSGLAPSNQLDPSMEVDIIVGLRDSGGPSEPIARTMAEVLGGKFEALRQPRRWGGVVQPVASISLGPEHSDLPRALWDIWITGSQFVTASPYWSLLFSTAEVGWQRDVRSLLSIEGRGARLYTAFKALSLAEARWRMAACWVPHLPDKIDGAQIDAPEGLPDLGMMPAELHGHCRAWRDGDMLLNWGERPLSLLTPEMSEYLLEASRKSLVDTPASPPWVDRMHGIQLHRQTRWFHARSRDRPE